MSATYVIWPKLDPATAHEILMCAQESNKKFYRKALDILAPRMGLRPAKIQEMPKVERHAYWAQLLGRPEMEALSFNFLSQWFIEKHTPLLCAWLDSFKIAHDGRGCADSFPPCPSKEAIKKSIDELLKKFDPKLVGIYLRTFNQIDGVQWKALDELIETEPKLAL
jgi:hypothetical protein